MNEMFDGWEECEVLISYDSAWAPPKPVIIEASRQHPALTFTLRYYECGCAFHGLFVVKNGEVESDLCADYYGERGG